MKMRSRWLHNLYTDIHGQGLVAVVAIVAERYTRVIAGNGCSGCDSCGEIYSVLEGDGCTGSPHIQ